MASFIATGDLDIHKFMTKDKLNQILAIIRSTGQTVASKPIKDLLGDEFSYGEIKMAQEYYKKMNS
jgi:hypothetical protein